MLLALRRGVRSMRSPGHVIGHGWARVGTGGHGGHARAREGTGLAARREMGKEAPVETVRIVRPSGPGPARPTHCTPEALLAAH